MSAKVSIILPTFERAGYLRLLFSPLVRFVRFYVLRLGFLDGRQGFMLAVSNAEGTYYRYVKLMLLHEPDEPARCEECGRLLAR